MLYADHLALVCLPGTFLVLALKGSHIGPLASRQTQMVGHPANASEEEVLPPSGPFGTMKGLMDPGWRAVLGQAELGRGS